MLCWRPLDARVMLTSKLTRAEVLQIFANLRSVSPHTTIKKSSLFPLRKRFLNNSIYTIVQIRICVIPVRGEKSGQESDLSNISKPYGRRVLIPLRWPSHKPSRLSSSSVISYETEEQPTFADHLKIHEHYKVREEGHDAQGVEILMDKINVLDGINFRFVLMYMLRKIHKEHNK